jgi:hypothetical protein
MAGDGAGLTVPERNNMLEPRWPPHYMGWRLVVHRPLRDFPVCATSIPTNSSSSRFSGNASVLRTGRHCMRLTSRRLRRRCEFARLIGHSSTCSALESLIGKIWQYPRVRCSTQPSIEAHTASPLIPELIPASAPPLAAPIARKQLHGRPCKWSRSVARSDRA